MRTTLFVDVILPIPVNKEFSYRVPFELNETIQTGVRVVVPFGKGKLYTGIVVRIHENAPKNYQAKYIESVLDEKAIVTNKQYKLWYWISEYYMAPIGDVMNAALPGNLKLASETKIVLHPDFESKSTQLDEKETLIVDALEVQEILSLKDISGIVGIKTIHPTLKRMIDKRIIMSAEELQHKYSPKNALYCQLEKQWSSAEQLKTLLNQLESEKRKEKQLDALLIFLQLAGKVKNYSEISILKTQIIDKGASTSALNSLEKNGIIFTRKKPISRLQFEKSLRINKKVLNNAQLASLEQIKDYFLRKDVCLLHGVTGSGKTEIYVELIQEQLNLGKQVLFLIPEIALTTQLIARLSKYFGQQVGVYHSKFNQNERVEIWNTILDNKLEQFNIILGARSSLFLPFQRLGLVIVDEEHENTFKQHDPAPRYHARDVAIVLAKFHDAKVLLGSATPSIESYFNTCEDKFGLVELNERFGNLLLPEILCANIAKERKQKSMHGHFSGFLLNEMKETLEKGKQIILFQNRRGFTPIWRCEVCDWTPSCKNCDVSLTYHKHSNSLKCHYCGYYTPPVGSCGKCGSNRLSMLGFGTEKIEDDLTLLLPDVKVGRLDLDSTRSKSAYSKILQQFDQQEIQVLVGTQMISKGLDFDHVALVGILDADMLLKFPDFRAFERSFQLMSQVAGRAGRKNERGKVIIQTAEPENWIIQQVIAHDYKSMYKQEIIERRNFHYPPFFKMIELKLKHKSSMQLDVSAQELGNILKNVFGTRVLGPEYPLVKRVNNLFIKVITLKIEREASQKKVKERILAIIDQFYSSPNNKSIRMSIDVDPN
jgi:primosomal protein N' (replication factor Y)